jgi:hypothetical protein
MMMLEKLEACPVCDEVRRWLYDSQLCCACGYGDPQRAAPTRTGAICARYSSFYNGKDAAGAICDIIEHLEAERDRYLAALAWIATFNTEASSRHAGEWLHDVVGRARQELQADLPMVEPAPGHQAGRPARGTTLPPENPSVSVASEVGCDD